MLSRFGLAICLVTGMLLGARTVCAEPETSPSPAATDVGGPSEPRQRAKLLYDQGLSAYRDGKYSDAIDRLLEADQEMPNAAFSYNIALVYEAMGDMRSALRWLRAYLRQKGSTADDTATRAKVRKLESELQARGLQQVTILSKPSGATLKIDGEASGVTPFTVELLPGSHQITLVLDGYQATQRLFALRPDRSMDLEVDLVADSVEPQLQESTAPAPIGLALPPRDKANANPAAAEQGASAPSSPIQVSTKEAPRWTLARVQPWTWISLGVGTALLTGAVYYEFARQDAEDRASRASQELYQSRFDEIGPLQTKARILGIVGSAALATGAVFLTVDLTKRNGKVTASFGCAPSGPLAIGMRGHF